MFERKRKQGTQGRLWAGQCVTEELLVIPFFYEIPSEIKPSTPTIQLSMESVTPTMMAPIPSLKKRASSSSSVQNPNPTSLKSIKWTIVSIAQAKFFPSYWSQTFDSVDCTVSRTGVFTALAVNKPANQSEDTINWTGIKYDPALDVTVDAVKSQVGRSMGWEQFGTGDDYRWFDARSRMSHAAIYYGQKVQVQGGPAEGVVKERFIHAAMDGYGRLRFGSFGPLDPFSNDTINSWNLSGNILSAPKLMSLSQGYAHVYREESDIITTYLLTDLPSYFPRGDIIKAVPGLKLKHIIPGVRNGTSFLACISTNSMYFISNYLETNNTTTNPITSQVHTITTPSSSTSTSLTLTLRPYLFVTSQYNETYATDTSPSNPIVQSTFQFGISLSSDGNIYGINLSANSPSNTFAQTENAGPSI
ncbi:hypothetical protein BKA57DRAFT_491796 [Linnemannia elongata]|nr:hypothetical protein BKA57DRAFT_491796 [Linnemannia elongata]